MRRHIGTCRRLFAALLLVALTGCANIARLDAPPAPAVETLPILGIANARFWLDSDPGALVREWREMERRQAAATPRGRNGRAPPAHYLALSGGGDNGAFGAGLMVGWTQSGQRPSFDMVTGISAGALIAPFAFLGPDYDRQLREVFTEVAPTDIVRLGSKLRAILFAEALGDTSPLYKLIERHVNAELMAAIAAEGIPARSTCSATSCSPRPRSRAPSRRCSSMSSMRASATRRCMWTAARRCRCSSIRR